MIELLKLFMAKPINGVIAVLCVVTLATHLGLTEVRLAQARLQQQQKVDENIATIVLDMKDMLVRVDENVKNLKERELRNANQKQSIK